MRLFLFEHVCCGGISPGEPLPKALRDPGAAMLQALAMDLTAAGHQVVTCLDSRVSLPMPGVSVTVIPPLSQVDITVHSLAKACDAALVIAPESDRLLEQWATKLAAWDIRSLGCTPTAIALCSDKWTLARHLQQHGIPTPATVLLAQIDELPPSPQRVIKPRWGAGCENTFVYSSDSIPAQVCDPQATIMQPWCPGLSASVCFLVHENRIIPLPPGQQKIALGPQLSYQGGCIPLPDHLATRATSLGTQAIQSIPGLLGWVGVDLILSNEPAHDQVIEINPRISMSYVGLRALCQHNLATALLAPDAPLAFASHQQIHFDATGHYQIRSLP